MENKEILREYSEGKISFDQYIDKRLSETDGILELYGRPIDRAIFMFGVQMPPFDMDFDWGYSGALPTKLAEVMLSHLQPSEAITKEYCESFRDVFVANLPSGRFHAKLNLKGFAEAIIDSNRRIHAFDLMELNIDKVDNPYWVSKFLDLPYLPVKTAYFQVGSIEHELLEYLRIDCQFSQYNEYLRKHTERPKLGDTKVLECADITYMVEHDCYHYSGGMGSAINFRGHQIGSYAKI